MIFVCGHSIIGVCMLSIGLFIDIGKPDLCLAFMCVAVITFQCTMGATFWVYASEVCTDAALGICIFLMFGTLALQSTTFIYLLDGIGVNVTFYLFGGF